MGNVAENWKEIVRKYQKPSAAKGTWQLVNSVGGYLALWALMYGSLSISYWLTGALAVLAGGLLVRVFIIFHDCGHGSFFKSKKLNDIAGFITGVLVLTPYAMWRKEHAIHHSASGDLDHRGVGDIPTMTVEEYKAASRWDRFCYRQVRNPLVLFIIGPVVMFVLAHRIPRTKEVSQAERNSVWWTNLALAGVAVGMSFIFGFWTYFILQVAVIAVAGSLGTWLFYVQHQFEGVYWERSEEWDFAAAALQGSSYYKLPKILQWFSGNIGFHHIHHLSPRIPNYNLEQCHEAEPLFQTVPSIDLITSFKSASYRLWDEENGRLVAFDRSHRSNRSRAKAEAAGRN